MCKLLCAIPKLICGLLCLAVLAAAGYCAWRFGPWYDQTNAGNANVDLAAKNTCEGCCNGLASNCNLPVNEYLFPTAHNAMSSRSDLFAGYNHLGSLEDALVAGYRGLMLDSCVCDGSLGEAIRDYLTGEDNGDSYLGFCHSSCDAGVRKPSEVLGRIKTFLDVNENEVVMLEFQVNDDSLAALHAAIDEAGLPQYIYQSAEAFPDWPTLGELIADGTRLLVFAHGDGIESCAASDCPEGVFYTNDHFVQTEWNDATCDPRGDGDADDADFFLMNHWMNNDADLPSKLKAEEFNMYDSLKERFGRCRGRDPSILAVDFWGVGDVLEFVRDENAARGGGGAAAAEARSGGRTRQ